MAVLKQKSSSNRSVRNWRSLFLVLIIFCFIAACGGGSSSTSSDPAPTTSSTQPTQTTDISQFAFFKTENPALSGDLVLQIDGTNISGRVPDNVDVTSLVASVAHGGNALKVNNIAQISGQTPNDFTQLQQYTVTTNDGSSKSYTVDLTKFTGLPIIYLSTENALSITSKDDYLVGKISISGGREFENADVVDMKIRGRGNSTWEHPKKPYQMKLKDNAQLLGMPEDRTWLFIAEYSDKTMLRNTITFEMGYMSSLAWTPKSEFSEVYLNDDYIGTYNITEKVEDGANRVNIGDTGYLLEIDQLERLDFDDVYFTTQRFLINIKEPKVDWGSAELAEVSALINDFERALFARDFKQQDTGYRAHIDVDSFIDWYLISEITKNVDSQFWSSIFLNVIPGQKIKMGPLWDFDLSFGNVDYADSQYPEGFWVKQHQWYSRLFQDPAFVMQVKARFAYFKANQSLILSKIDAYTERLKWAQAENNKRWQTLGVYVWPNPVVFATHQEEVDYMKAWFTDRMEWLDQEFRKL